MARPYTHYKTDAERAEAKHRQGIETARRRYTRQRVGKWQEALEYLLQLEGDIPELAEQMAKKYNINKVPY